MLSKPTVSGGRQEATYLLGGSLKQDMWVVAKVTIISRHPGEGEGGAIDSDVGTKAEIGIHRGKRGACVVSDLLIALTSLVGHLLS